MANWSRSDKFFWEQKKGLQKNAAEEKKKDETVPGKWRLYMSKFSGERVSFAFEKKKNFSRYQRFYNPTIL